MADIFHFKRWCYDNADARLSEVSGDILAFVDEIAAEAVDQAVLNGIGSEREARLMAKVGELEAVSKKMALDLECMILNPNNWKDSAHESLQAYQDLMDRWYPQEHVSPLGAD